MIHIRRRRADRSGAAPTLGSTAPAAGPAAAGSRCLSPAIRTCGSRECRAAPVPPAYWPSITRSAQAGPPVRSYRRVRYKFTMSENSTDLSGRTFLITGANTGIGRATADDLARRGGKVFVASRSAEKGLAAAAQISAATGNEAVAFLPPDLADLASVRNCAAEFLARGDPLHVLINNA